MRQVVIVNVPAVPRDIVTSDLIVVLGPPGPVFKVVGAQNLMNSNDI